MGSLTLPAPLPVPGFWEAFGHSYFMTTVGTLYQSGRMDAIVRSGLDIEQASWRNRCVTGAQLMVQGRAQGGYNRMLQECTKSQRTAPYAANGGGCFMVWGINDPGIQGVATQQQTAYGHALRTCISRWRASSVKEETDASISYGAGFTANSGTQDYSSGTGTRRATSTTSATITITIPADYNGETLAVAFIGAAGVFGGTITFSGTASMVSGQATLVTSNIMSGSSGSHTIMVRRMKGPASDATKTIIMTMTQVDASGSVEFDGYWLEADNPPPVIVANIARLLTAGYASYTTWSASQASADTDVANFNTVIKNVVAEFDSMVQIADLDGALNKNLTLPAGISTYYASDSVHANEYGAAACADAFIAAVRRLTPPGGLSPSGYLQVDAPQGSGRRCPRLSSQFYLPDFGSWDATVYTPAASTWHIFALPVVITEGRERWIQFQAEVVSTPTTGSSIRWGIYDDVGWTGYPQDLVIEATSGGALAIGTTSGMKVSPTSGAGQLNQPLDPGLYWIAIKMDTIVSTVPTFRAIKGPNRLMPCAAWVAGTQGLDVAWRITAAGAGALPTTFTTGGVSVGTAAGSCPAVGFKIF